MWLKTFALLVAAIMLPGTALAQAEYRQNPYGAQGDNGLEVRCYGDRYIVGITGRAGSNIDRIQLLCARIGPDGLALPSDTKSVDVGGLGGAPLSANCNAQAYATGVNVHLTDTKKQVEGLSVACESRNGKGDNPFFSNGLHFIGYFDGPTSRHFPCPAGMALTGLTVRYGQHVNAVGPICNRLVLQPAPVAVTPPGPARTGRVVDYGHPKNGDPSPPKPVVKQPSFIGSYALSSRGGGKMTLVVNAADGNDVFGTLTTADPRYNGAFTGTVSVDGRTFTINYRDAATGQTGSGTMRYNGQGGKMIIGVIKSNGPPPVSDVWGGPRQ